MDNKQFNVNGEGQQFLAATLKLAFMQCDQKPRAYTIDKEKGLVIYWTDGEQNTSKFISPPSPEALAEMAIGWLNTKEADLIPCIGEDANADHDGDNSKGWRVYCEMWGHVGKHSYALIAIKPAYLWYGK